MNQSQATFNVDLLTPRPLLQMVSETIIMGEEGFMILLQLTTRGQQTYLQIQVDF